MKQKGFFAASDRLTRLSIMEDPLERIAAAVDFEVFISVLNKAFSKMSSPMMNMIGQTV